jgi:hypothetical protein
MMQLAESKGIWHPHIQHVYSQINQSKYVRAPLIGPAGIATLKELRPDGHGGSYGPHYLDQALEQMTCTVVPQAFPVTLQKDESNQLTAADLQPYAHGNEAQVAKLKRPLTDDEMEYTLPKIP